MTYTEINERGRRVLRADLRARDRAAGEILQLGIEYGREVAARSGTDPVLRDLLLAAIDRHRVEGTDPTDRRAARQASRLEQEAA